jgi:hypothetical protein
MAEVHKIPARVQCTLQVCELAVSNLHPPPHRSRQIICLSQSEPVRLPLQFPMRLSPHQLHAGPGRSIPCTCAQHSSTHHRTLRCARLVHLCRMVSWKFYSCSAGQWISSFHRIRRFIVAFTEAHQLDPVLNKLHPFHTLTPNLFNISLNTNRLFSPICA